MKPNSANHPVLRIPFRRIGYTEEYHLLETGQIVCRVFKGEVADGLEESMEVVTSQDARAIRLKNRQFDQWLNEIGWEAGFQSVESGMRVTEKESEALNETNSPKKDFFPIKHWTDAVWIFSIAANSLLDHVLPSSIRIGILFTMLIILAAFHPSPVFRRFSHFRKRLFWSMLISLEFWTLTLAFCLLFGYPIWR